MERRLAHANSAEEMLGKGGISGGSSSVVRIGGGSKQAAVTKSSSSDGISNVWLGVQQYRLGAALRPVLMASRNLEMT
jgi:hypothetical protein